MTRLILFFILSVFVARAFWRAVDGVIEGMTGRPRGTRSPERGVSMVRDPVCGTFVLPANAVKMVDGRLTVYFCSDACRSKYRAKSA
jgi:YHS domain-containing protein